MRRELKVGERVRYDENFGKVLEIITSGRAWGPDYKVEWDNGHVSIVWGSDLEPS